MEIFIHAGVLDTDETRLMSCLNKNRELFAQNKVAIPDPDHYRKPLRQVLIQMSRDLPSTEARDVLLDTILQDSPDDVSRVVMIIPQFFGSAQEAIDNNVFYPMSINLMTKVSQLFPQDTVHLSISMKNPATFLPSLLAAMRTQNIQELIKDNDVKNLQWSKLIYALQSRLPNINLTTWCSEDNPFLWGQILRYFGGLSSTQTVSGAYLLVEQILTPEGLQRFRDYLKTHPVMNERQRRRVIAAFIEKFAKPDSLSTNFEFGDWTQDTVSQLTRLYEEDNARITSIPAINFLQV